MIMARKVVNSLSRRHKTYSTSSELNVLLLYNWIRPLIRLLDSSQIRTRAIFVCKPHNGSIMFVQLMFSKGDSSK